MLDFQRAAAFGCGFCLNAGAVIVSLHGTSDFMAVIMLMFGTALLTVSVWNGKP